MKSKKHRLLRSLVGFLAVCVLFELVLRLFGYGHYTIYRPDQRLLWIPEPGRTLTVVNHLPITINHQGMRYASDLQRKQPDQFRIIAVGDSSTQGWGVDDNSHFSARLEKMLNHSSCTRERFQVVSGGVNAYPNSLVAEKLKEVVEDDTLRPDVAIVAYSYNSNLEKLAKLQGAERQKFLRRVEWKSIARRSAIYNFLIEDLLRKFAYYELRHVIVAGTLDTMNGMDNLDMDQYNHNLQQSLQYCRANHVQLIFLMLGSEGQTISTPLHPFQKAMIDFAEKQHVPLVNMIPVMSEKNQAAMFMDTAHPTAAGHLTIAEQLRAAIESLPAYTQGCGTSAVAVAQPSKQVRPLPTLETVVPVQ